MGSGRLVTDPKRQRQQKSVEDIPTEVIDDPLLFVPFVWPHIKLYPKQAEVLESVRYNFSTLVHAANEVGKDFTASLAVVWFFASRSPCRIVTTSSTERQLKTVLWGEIRTRLNEAQYDFGWDLSTMTITRDRKDKPDPKSLVMGQVARDPESFQGHHLDHDFPRILCVFDECSAIADAFYEAAESWSHRILSIGNPMNTTNYFYRLCKEGDKYDAFEEKARGGEVQQGVPRKKSINIIHISGDDSPNVIAGKAYDEAGRLDLYEPIIPGVLCYREYLQRQVMWDKKQRRVRLEGHFYEGDDAFMFPNDWLNQSHRAFRDLVPTGFDNDKPRKITAPSVNLAMGVDCGAGRDLSVWTIIDRAGIVYQHAEPTPDTYKLVTFTKALIQRFNINPGRVCLDAGGGGKQTVDTLRAQGLKQVRAVQFGSSASPPPATKTKRRDEKIDAKEDLWIYKNKRVEMHDKLRRWMDPSTNLVPFAIPEELHELVEELAVLPIQYDGEGKQELPPKDKRPGRRENPDEITLKKLLGRSPDRGDSLVLAVEALTTKPKTVAGAIRR